MGFVIMCCMLLNCEKFFQDSQIVWIQIRRDIESALVRVQSVCKDYQQRILVDRVKYLG